MHHVIQNNLWNEFGFKTIIDALEEVGAPYTIAKVVPFIHELEPDVNPEGHVMVWGATTLGHIARKKGWYPGCFQNDNFDMRYLKRRFGPNFLNEDAQFCTFGELNYEGLKFIRPVHDSKTFSGIVMDGSELAEWRQQVLDISDGFSTLTMDTPVMYAEPKNIQLEARFFIVDGTIVSGSSYRTLGRQILYQRVDSNNPLFLPLLAFANNVQWVDYSELGKMTHCIRAKPIDRAFVLDVGMVDNEYKVVEINAINNSGFYATDMKAVIRALENMRL